MLPVEGKDVGMVQLFQYFYFPVLESISFAESWEGEMLHSNLAPSFGIPSLIDFPEVALSKAREAVVGEPWGDLEVVFEIYLHSILLYLLCNI